jgi:hypothetical protein
MSTIMVNGNPITIVQKGKKDLDSVDKDKTTLGVKPNSQISETLKEQKVSEL